MRHAEEEERRRERARAGSTSCAASCESSRRRRASPHSRYSGSESTSSATNIVSRSFAAGNSIMPPTANSVSGNTSVCADAGQQPRRAPRRCRAPPRPAAVNGADLVSRTPAISSTLTKREHQDRALQEQRRAGRCATAPTAATWPGLPSPTDLLRGQRHDGQHERAGQAAERQRQLQRAAQRPRRERLDEHAGDGRRRRRSASGESWPVLDVRGGIAGASAATDPVTACSLRARARPTSPGAAGPDRWMRLRQGLLDRRIDHVE